MKEWPGWTLTEPASGPVFTKCDNSNNFNLTDGSLYLIIPFGNQKSILIFEKKGNFWKNLGSTPVLHKRTKGNFALNREPFGKSQQKLDCV